jgi:hypothetical protein
VSAVSHIDVVNSDSALKQFAAAAWMLKSSGGCRDSVDSLQYCLIMTTDHILTAPECL